MNVNKKIHVLTQIGQAFNKHQIGWAVGGSLLLYLKGYVDAFNDLDIMVLEDDVLKAKEIIESWIQLETPPASEHFRSKYFFQCKLDGVDIDLVAGMKIVKDNQVHDCALRLEDIDETIMINEVKIPLHSIERWTYFYQLMDRHEKLDILKQVIKEEELKIIR